MDATQFRKAIHELAEFIIDYKENMGLSNNSSIILILYEIKFK